MSDTLRQEQAADHAMRNWVHKSRGPVQIGSDAHK
ncbi:ferritin-like domain-containing protein, partial [Burkholderia thailandensis]|nr:ferritin-like domain-containing protein [Burkholderia thailandensis]